LATGPCLYLSCLRKVAKTRCDLEATESQLSAAVENLKGIKEETDKYKREVGALQDQLREAELTFKHKIAAHERSALDNWTKARVWERKIVQQSRENAYVRHRCASLTCPFLGVLRGQG